MADPNVNKASDGNRAVGVYDRPASADRARHLRIIVIVVAVVASLGGIYMYLV